MDALLYSIRTVFPVIFIIAAGYFARRMNIIRQEGINQANKCVFFIFLPIMLGLNVLEMEITDAVDFSLLAFGLISVLIMFGSLFFFVPRLCKTRAACGVLIQGIGRSNYAVFGIPLVSMMYPNSNLAIMSLMVAVAIPMYNLLSVIALMRYGEKQANLLDMIKGIAFNPLIISTLGGLLLFCVHFTLPDILSVSLHKLGSIASPLALFVLGATIDTRKAQSNFRLVSIAVATRLLLVPFIFLSAAVILGIRDVGLATLIALFAAPTAVSTYPMTQQLGGDADLAAKQVIGTTIFSGITVFLWIFVLKTFGFLA